MLARLGVAGCILVLIATLLLASTAIGSGDQDALRFTALYALICFSILVFLGGEAVDAMRKFRKDAGQLGWTYPVQAAPSAQKRAPQANVDDLVGMLGDTLKLAGRAPAVAWMEPIDMTDLLRTLVKQTRSARLTVTAKSKSFHALASRPAIARAFEILVENALTNSSRASLSCDHGTSNVVVHVDDDGPGVPRSERTHVFDWHYYMSTPPSQQVGCRAELVIARQIVRAHGGDIVVGASPLGGARYTVRLPLVSEHELVLAIAS
jgi:C4-dicarboxylate-specific signal transduction histidine kinase